MKNERIIIRGDFLPITLRLLGWLMLSVSGLTIYSQYKDYVSILLFVIGAFLASSRFGTLVDPKRQTIKKYLSVFLILRIGRRYKYEFLTCFWIKAHKMKAVWQNQAVSYETPEFGVVDVYLVTSDGDNHYLFEDRSKQSVYRRLSKAMQELSIKCQDKTS